MACCKSWQQKQGLHFLSEGRYGVNIITAYKLIKNPWLFLRNLSDLINRECLQSLNKVALFPGISIMFFVNFGKFWNYIIIMGGSGIAFYVSYIHYKAMYVNNNGKSLKRRFQQYQILKNHPLWEIEKQGDKTTW